MALQCQHAHARIQAHMIHVPHTLYTPLEQATGHLLTVALKPLRTVALKPLWTVALKPQCLKPLLMQVAAGFDLGRAHEAGAWCCEMRWWQARAAAATHPVFFAPAPLAYLEVKLRAGEMMRAEMMRGHHA